MLHRMTAGVVTENYPERVLGCAQGYPVLWPLRASDRWHHGRNVQLEVLGVLSLAGVVVPQSLSLGIGLDQRDLVVAASGQAQVLDGLVIHREHRDRRAVLRAHISDGRAVGQRNRINAAAIELDELAD